MTQEISFISAGEDEKEAISFLLKFVEEKFLELGSSPQNKINLRCNDAAQANELDQKLWEDLNEVFLAHKISNDAKIPSCPCLLYTSPSPRDVEESRMPSSA